MSRNIRNAIPQKTLQIVIPPKTLPLKRVQAVRRRNHSHRWIHPRRRIHPFAATACVLFLLPIAAYAQSGSPFDSGLISLQNLFTRTVARVASLIAIVIGGYGFAHGDPGAKKTLAGVAAGTGIAVLATNVLSWLWGI